MRAVGRSWLGAARAAVLATAAMLASESDASAQSLVNFMAGRQWAVGGAVNCRAPSQSYFLAASGGTITWQNGVGHVDVERITGSSPGYFGTVTVSSYHPGGRPVPIGTSWSYRLLGGSLVGVSSSAASFTLAPC